MPSSRERFILGIASVITFITTTYLTAKFLFSFNLESSSQLTHLLTLISAFHISMLLGWLAFGSTGGILISTLSVIIGFLVILKVDHPECALLPGSFLLTSFVGYNFLKMTENSFHSHTLKIEKLDEETTILSSAKREKEKVISALEAKLNRYSVLKDVATSLSTVLAIEDVESIIVERVRSTVAKDGRAFLFLINTEKQELSLSASYGMLKSKEKKGDFFDQWVFRHRKSLIIEDIGRDFRFPDSEVDKAKESFKSLIATPIITGNKLLGIIRMDHEKEFAFAQDDLRLLDIISGLGAVALQNAYLYSRTQELAIRDGLTGLFVRRVFMERFQEELRRGLRAKHPFSLLMLDIDHFKTYNDQYGHTSGDLVLKHISRIVTFIVGEGGIVGRYGGEELAILLIGADKDRALKEAEEIRVLVEKKPLMLRRKESHVTVSIGVSAYPSDSSVREDLIRIADERLYKAKTKGRNRVCAG